MRTWILGARPRTLPAAVVPVVVGTAAVRGDVLAWRFVAALVVALALQVGTNYANDYSDGVRGTDAADRVGPTRLVGSGLVQPAAVKQAAFVSFGVAAVAGLALTVAVGPQLIPVGAASILAGWFYTGGPRPYGYAGYGELFVFVFFGLVATVGSTYVQQEELTGLSFAVAVPVGLLATAILVVNNLRDVPSDRRSGKRTLAVLIGDRATRWLYGMLVVGAFTAVALIGGLSEPWALLAFAAVLVALEPMQAVASGLSGPALVPALGGTARLQLVFGLLLALGLWIA